MQWSLHCWTWGELAPSTPQSQKLTQHGPILLMARQRALNRRDYELCIFAIKSESIHCFEISGDYVTFFCWKHSDDTAEYSLSHAVIDSHFHFKLRQGCNAVISVNISRRIRWSQHCLDPGAAANWTESHNIAKVLSALLFFWNWLR